MPPSVVAAVALAVLLAVEALGVLGYWAFTASGRGVEGAGVFIGGVLFAVHAGQFVAGAVHRRAGARTAALRKALVLAALAAVVLAAATELAEDPVPRELVLGVAVGFVAPLAVVGLLLLGRSARGWFDRPGPA